MQPGGMFGRLACDAAALRPGLSVRQTARGGTRCGSAHSPRQPLSRRKFMTTEPHPTPPEGGRISIQNGLLPGPRPPDHSLHRGRRHRAGHLAGQCPRIRRRRRSRLRRSAPHRVARGAGRREGLQRDRRLASRRDGSDLPGLRGRDQRTPHHAGGRRDPLAQRGAPQLLDLYVCLRR